MKFKSSSHIGDAQIRMFSNKKQDKETHSRSFKCLLSKTNSVLQFLLEVVNKPPPKQPSPKMGDPNNNLVRRSNSKQSNRGQEYTPIFPFNRVTLGQG